jgi:subtilisin family serine protease
MRKVLSLILTGALSLVLLTPSYAENLVPTVSAADAELLEFIEESEKRVPVGLDERGRAWVLANTAMVPEPVGDTGLYATNLKTTKALEAVSALSDSAIFPNFMVNLDDPIVVENAVNPASVLGVNPVTKISANEVHADGNTGENVAIAIIDTGIDPDHPYFKDAAGNSRIVAEACFVGIGFSAASPTNNFPCLDNSTQQIGLGSSDITNHVESGEPLSRSQEDSAFSSGGTTQAEWASIMDHGTHVAGLAAGSSNTLASIPDSAPGGIAPDADIISIRVFGYNAGWYWDDESNYWYFSTGRAYYLDIVAAVDWVTETQATYNTAALNLSLGGGEYSSACDGDISNNFTAARNAGVAPLVASGNDGFDDAISWPACASSAIAVGASTGADQIAGFSNSGEMLDIAAPGVDVGSAVPRVNGDYSASAYERWNGTSMATPVAAGAFALMRLERPDLSIDDLEEALKETGFLIDDVVVQDIPRINVDSAIASLGNPPLAQTISVSGETELVVNQTVEVTASASSNLLVSVTSDTDSDVCTFTSTTEGAETVAEVTATGGGTCELSFNQIGGSGYTAATAVVHEIQIEKLTQEISIDGPTTANVSSTIELTASSSSGLNLSSTLFNSTGICTSTGSNSGGVRTVTLSFLSAGTCIVRFTQAGNNVYKSADLVARQITVSRNAQNLVITVPSQLIAGNTGQVSASASSVSVTMATSTSNVCSVSGFNVTALSAGECVLLFNAPESSSYEAATETRTISVSAPNVSSVRMLSPKKTAKSVTVRWNAPTNLALSGFSNYTVKYRISYPGKKFSSWKTRNTTARTFRIALKGAKYRLEYTVTAVAPDSMSRATKGNVKTY